MGDGIYRGSAAISPSLDRTTNWVFPFDTKVRCGSQEVCVVRIHVPETILGSRGKVKRIRCPEKCSGRKTGIDLGDFKVCFIPCRKPLKGPRLVVNTHLSKQCRIRCLRDSPFPQLPMEGRNHLSLAMGRTG